MNKKVTSIVAVVFSIVIFGSIIAISFISCGQSSQKKIINDWVCEKVHDGYPDTMTLFEDGSGLADGVHCYWHLKDGYLYLSSSIYTYETFYIHFEQDKLYLNDYGYFAKDSQIVTPTVNPYQVPNGTYRLIEVSGTGAEVYGSIKDQITLEINDNGIGELKYNDRTAAELVFDEGTGKVSLDGSTIHYSVDGNTITIKAASGNMIFER